LEAPRLAKVWGRVIVRSLTLAYGIEAVFRFEHMMKYVEKSLK